MKLLSLLKILWIRIGDILGYINSRLILGIIFFLILTPLSLFLRVLNKRPLAIHFRPKGSYYMEKGNSNIEMEVPF